MQGVHPVNPHDTSQGSVQRLWVVHTRGFNAPHIHKGQPAGCTHAGFVWYKSVPIPVHKARMGM